MCGPSRALFEFAVNLRVIETESFRDRIQADVRHTPVRSHGVARDRYRTVPGSNSGLHKAQTVYAVLGRIEHPHSIGIRIIGDDERNTAVGVCIS